MNLADNRWLRRDHANPSATARLVCLPHAGGPASFFRQWGEALPDVEVYAVRYPGRAERIAEPPPTDLRQLARQIAHAVRPLGDRPLALFGHSLGAPVALEAGRELERLGVSPVHLFASGSRDAEVPPPAPAPLVVDDDEALRQLVQLGGTDAEMAADPLFRELVLPYVMSDTKMFHSYDMALRPTLRCPVTTIVGDQDSDSDLRPWHRLTSGPVRETVVPGGHFYLVEQPPYDQVAGTLAAAARPR